MPTYYLNQKFKTTIKPYKTPDNRYTCIFEGVLTNEHDLCKKLKKTGIHLFAPTTEEIILELYRFCGDSFAQELCGTFTIIIFDKEHHQLIAARDRYGVRPLYYKLVNNGIKIASKLTEFQIKSKTLLDGLDKNALRHYFSYGYIPEEYTYLKNVHHVPAGCLLKYNEERLTITPFTDMLVIEGTHQQLIDEQLLHTVLTKGICTGLSADKVIGILYTGKTEERVLATIAKQAGCEVKIFSAEFYKKQITDNSIKTNKAQQKNNDNDRDTTVNEPHETDNSIKTNKAHQKNNDNDCYTTVNEMHETDNSIKINKAHQKNNDNDRDTTVNEMHETDNSIKISQTHQKISAKDYWHATLNAIHAMDIPLADPSAPIDYLLAKLASQNVDMLLLAEGADVLFGTNGTIFERMKKRNGLIFTENAKTKLLKFEGNPWSEISNPYLEQISDLDSTSKWQTLELNIRLKGSTILKKERLTKYHDLKANFPFLNDETLNIAKFLTNDEKKSMFLLKKIFANQILDSQLPKKKDVHKIPLATWIRTDLYENIKTIFKQDIVEEIFNTDILFTMLQQHHLGFRDLSCRIWAVTVFIIWLTKLKN